MCASFEPSRRFASRALLAAASGVLLTLIYPPFNLSLLAWIALAPLLIALDGARARAAFGLGWLTGTLGAIGVTGFWIFHAAHDYFHFSTLGAAIFVVGTTQVFVAGYFGLFAVAVVFVPAGRLRRIVTPSLFVASEYLRAHLLSGNPWELLGHSLQRPALMQLCDLTGVYGLSFLLVMSAVALAELHRTRLPAAIVALAVVATVIYGHWRVANLTLDSAARWRVLVVQGNLPNDQRGRPELFAEHLNRYVELSQRAGALRPDLIVWPENAMAFFPAENPLLMSRVTEMVRAEGAPLLTGAPRAGERPGVAAIYNSAYLFTPEGAAGVYDKRKLLPFVERSALRPEDGPYLSGGAPTLFTVSGVRFGGLICYEAIYPELARELVQRGAQLLVNVSNDSWFESGAGPEQHYRIARFRAVESRVSLVRVTNSGVSGAIDPAGREIARLPVGTPLAQLISVPIVAGGSFYSRHGDVFSVLCMLVSISALAGRLLAHFRH